MFRSILLVILCVGGAELATPDECSRNGIEFKCKHAMDCRRYIKKLKKCYKLGLDSSEIQHLSPHITRPPLNITVPPGGTARFECVSKGAPTPQTTITKRDETIIPSKSSFTQFIADRESQISTIQEIDNIVKANEGWYRCVSCNYYDCATADAYLRVLDLCEGVECQAPKVCAADYDAGTASCQCPDFCDGQFNPDVLCSNYCETKFSTCVMENDACRDGLADVAVLYKGACKKIDPPSVQGIVDENRAAINQVKQVEEEGTITLECKASGSPQPEITWYNDKGAVGRGAVLRKKLTLADSGAYYCVATNCMNKEATSGSVDVVVVPLPTTEMPTTSYISTAGGPDDLTALPMPLSTCQVYGDPHFKTYDARTYDFHGQCDYVLAMDCEMASWFVYGRMRKCGKTGGSCLATVTIYYKNDIVELMRGWLVNHYGNKVVPKNHVDQTLYVGERANFSMVFDGKYLEVTAVLKEAEFAGGKDEVLRVKWDGYTSALIQSPQTTRTCGLCGNNDGNSNNDFRGRRGVSGDDPTVFGESWKIDRRGRCPAPVDSLTPAEVCGRGYNDAKAECERIFSIPNFNECVENGHDKADFINACIYDTCEGNMNVQELPPACMAAHAYAMVCTTDTWQRGQGDIPYKALNVEAWEEAAGCPTEQQRYQPILDSGCPQPSLEEELALKENA